MEVDVVSRFLRQGFSNRAIAAELEVSIRSLRQFRKNHGIIKTKRIKPPNRRVRIDVEAVRVLAEKGNSDRAIAAQIGCSIWGVSTLRRRHGIFASRKCHPVNAESVCHLVALGMTDKEIAEKLGGSKISVSRIRLRYEIEAGRPKRAPIDVDSVRGLASQGMSDPQIAAELGVARTSIRRVRERHGIEPGYVKARKTLPTDPSPPPARPHPD